MTALHWLAKQGRKLGVPGAMEKTDRKGRVNKERDVKMDTEKRATYSLPIMGHMPILLQTKENNPICLELLIVFII